MYRHKCRVNDRVEVKDLILIGPAGTWRGRVLSLGREGDIGGDREDGYWILADDDPKRRWAFDYTVRKLSLLELIAEAAV